MRKRRDYEWAPHAEHNSVGEKLLPVPFFGWEDDGPLSAHHNPELNGFLLSPSSSVLSPSAENPDAYDVVVVVSASLASERGPSDMRP